jgi:endoglycosylceramidase
MLSGRRRRGPSYDALVLRRGGIWGAMAVAALCALTAACSGGDGRGDGRGDGGDGGGGGAGPELPALTAVRGERPAVVDDQGRQVTLRGVNVNSLVEYARANDELAPTLPVTDDDWDAMAAEGFSVVRLLVSWSRLEPERGEVDGEYVESVRDAVRDAAARGMYTVLDMHQDAWGPHVATPEGVACPPGLEPAIGWDGAPAWATPAAGVNACRGGGREDSDLVRESWRRFYADEDGVRSSLVAVWEHLAAELSAEPGVAGYDLLNEPGHAPGDATVTTDGLAEFYREAIAGVRAGERTAGAGPKPAFFEYTVTGSPVPTDFSDDPALVFAPHVYGSSIAPLSVEQNWAYAAFLAGEYGTALWAGEYGWFGDPADDLPEVRTFGRQEDQHLAGSAWWQWRQACGDPHSVGTPGGTPADVIVEYRNNGCPGDRDLGVVDEWHEVVSRPYPRAAPGRLRSVESDGATRTLRLAADGAEPGATLDLWVPGDQEPVATGQGIAAVEARAVDGGWRVTAKVCTASYEATIGGAGDAAPPTCPAGQASPRVGGVKGRVPDGEAMTADPALRRQ